MLILSRRVDESLIIECSDGIIEVKVTRVTAQFGNRFKVGLGIDAPPEVTVDRKEVYESKQREKQQ